MQYEELVYNKPNLVKMIWKGLLQTASVTPLSLVLLTFPKWQKMAKHEDVSIYFFYSLCVIVF